MGITKYFMKKKTTLILFEKHEEIMELLLKGLTNYLIHESLSTNSSEILLKMIRSSGFGDKGDYTYNFVAIIKKIFSSNKTLFVEFMDNYNKFLNGLISDFSINLRDITTVKFH